uniref:Uncharacterized protein n=1 Tax=Anguilla anguilla TaxID=7936 RepID=A0A0E9RP76_ANGAN
MFQVRKNRHFSFYKEQTYSPYYYHLKA